MTVLFSVALTAGYIALMSLFRPMPPPLEAVTAENFSFSNYSGSSVGALYKVFQKIFPAGTPKAEIDGFLVDKHGAACERCDGAEEQARKNGAADVVYMHRSWPWTCYPMGGLPHVRVMFEYDGALKLKSMRPIALPGGGCQYL